MGRLTSGLALAGIFAWILAFPMFGRFLVDTAGERAALAGLIFALSHGLSLLLLHLLPLRIATEPIWVRGAAGLITVTSILYAGSIAEPSQLTSFILLGWMGVLGIASAFVVLAWVPTFTRQVRPLSTLLIAMPSANLIVALVSVPVALPTLPTLTLLSLLPLASAHLIGRSLKESEAELDATALVNRMTDLAPTRPRRIRELVLFALAVYFAGGLWYQHIATSGGPWAATTGALISAAVVAAVGLITPKEQSERLLLFTVTFLGIGLLISSEWLGLRWATPVYSALLLAGFATGDLHFWNQLGLVGIGRDGRRALGLGLGGSLVLIAVTGMLPGSSWISLLFAHPSSSTMGAILLFLVIPLLYSPQWNATMTVATAGEVQPPVPPRDLTRTELQVWELLLHGASDPEIGTALGISRHTAKFHVRNVLQKAGAANRKGLLASLLTHSERHVE